MLISIPSVGFPTNLKASAFELPHDTLTRFRAQSLGVIAESPHKVC